MIFDILGWIGAVMVVGAYALLSMKKIDSGKIYQAMNLVAGILIVIGLLPKNAWFSFALNAVWSVIALVSLIKIFSNKSIDK